MEKSVAERQILRDAVSIGRINDHRTAETAAALGTLGLGQVAFAGVAAQNFAGAGDLEPLGHGFFRFDAFGSSHKIFIAKERELYVATGVEASAIFEFNRIGRTRALRRNAAFIRQRACII